MRYFDFLGTLAAFMIAKRLISAEEQLIEGLSDNRRHVVFSWNKKVNTATAPQQECCGLCRRNCPLSALRCGRGKKAWTK